MEDYKDVTMIKLTDNFMTRWGEFEEQKKKLKEVYETMVIRQNDMLYALICQFELGDGRWEVDAETNFLLKKEDTSPEGSR